MTSAGAIILFLVVNVEAIEISALAGNDKPSIMMCTSHSCLSATVPIYNMFVA